MKRLANIVWIALACLFGACGVTHHIIDDSYYYAGDEPAVVQTVEPEATPVQEPQGPPVITYTNVQDTTVTIKVKR